MINFAFQQVDTNDPHSVARYIGIVVSAIDDSPRPEASGSWVLDDRNGDRLTIAFAEVDRVEWSIRDHGGNELLAEGGWSFNDRTKAEADIDLIDRIVSEACYYWSADVYKCDEDGEWDVFEFDVAYDISVDASELDLTHVLRKWLADNAITEGEWMLAATAHGERIVDSEAIALPEISS